MAPPTAIENRCRGFKNRDKNNPENLKSRRTAVTVELRKEKRDEQILKKRNVTDLSISPLKENNQQTPIPLLPLEEITKILISETNQPENKIYQATQSTRRLLSREKNPPIDSVIKAGLVTRLVELLKYETNSNIQFEAAWAITNIASGSSEQTKQVVESGAVDIFIILLRSPHANIVEQSVWALGNIAGDGPELRDFVTSRGVVNNLLELIKPNTPYPFLRNVAWTMSNLCRNKNPPPNMTLLKPMLQPLANLVHHPDKEVVADSCWALSYLTDGPNEKIQAVLETGVVRRLADLLSDDAVNIVTPALRAIGNIVTGDDNQTQAVINSGALPHLAKLFTHQKGQIVKEAAWAVSNITAGNQKQIQAVIDAELIPHVIRVLDKGEFKVKKESVWVITNYTSGGSIAQIVYLLNENVLGPLCAMLKTADPKVTMVALEAVNNILLNAGRMNQVDQVTLQIEECMGLDNIEELQSHENTKIAQTAYEIIETYFPQEDGEDVEEVAPQASAQGDVFQFGVQQGSQAFSL